MRKKTTGKKLAVLPCENGLGRTERRRGSGDFSVKKEQYVGCLDLFWVFIKLNQHFHVLPLGFDFFIFLHFSLCDLLV